METIQQRIRNQRGGKGLLTTYKYLIANGGGSFPQYQTKRYNSNKTVTNSASNPTVKATATAGTINAEARGEENEVELALVNNTTELESCEIHDMQTKSAATATGAIATSASASTSTSSVVASELLVNAMVVANDHLHHQQHQLKALHQQQLHNHQRLTLMAITQNSLTTGSAATLASSGSNSSSASSSSGASSASSTTGSCGNHTSSTGGGGAVIDNHTMQHKLSASDNNQQHHHHHQPHLVNGIVGVGGVTVAGLAMKQKNIAIISPNSHNNGGKASTTHHHKVSGGSNKSPTVLRKHHEHHHAADISKFNRSNRKSKNCAIFYFKHLDTDNETNYSNSNCGDDVHDVVVGGGGGGALPSSAASSHASDVSSCNRVLVVPLMIYRPHPRNFA